MILGEPSKMINVFFCAMSTNSINVFGPLTIAFNGFSMVFGSLNHHHELTFSPKTIGFNGHGPLDQRCDGFDGLFTSN